MPNQRLLGILAPLETQSRDVMRSLFKLDTNIPVIKNEMGYKE